MKNIDFKKYIPHAVAILSFIVIALVYFYPVLEGYRLNQGDIEKHKSMSSEINSHKEKYDENALWSGNLFAGMPTYMITKVKYDGNIIKYFFVLAKGGLPHPANVIFAYLLGFYILFLCLRINPWLAIVGAIAFAFSSYFLIIIEAGHNTKAYAIAFMAPILGGFIEIIRGRIRVGVILVAIFTALELYSNHLQITYYLFLVLLFVGVAELVYAIRKGITKEFFKRISFVLLAAILGVLPSIGNLLITYEYSKQSTRGKTDLTIQPDGTSNKNNLSSGLDKDYITQWSYGIDETLTLIIPDAKGGKSVPVLGDEKEVERLRKEDPQLFNVFVSEYQQNQNAVLSYFGNQPIVSGPVYLGIIIAALAFLALLFVRDRLVLPLFLVSVLTIALAWGKNFMPLTEFFIDYIPGYNKFRAVAMILLVTEFTAPILAILFLNKLIKERELILQHKKKVFIGLGVVGALLLLIAVSPDSFIDLSSKSEMEKMAAAGQNVNPGLSNQAKIEAYRADIVSNSAWRSIKYFALASALLLLFLFGKIKKEILIAGIGVLVFIDLWSIDKIYLNNEKAQGASQSGTKYVSWLKPERKLIPYEPSGADLAIMQNEMKENPSLSDAVQKRVNNYKNEVEPRPDRRKVYELQFAELMDQTHYRVLNTNARLDQDVKTPFFHKALGGYHGAKMKKYQEVVDFYLAIEHYQLRQAFAQAGSGYVQQMLPSLRITNLLNAKYVIGPDNTGKQAEALVKNPYANGNAWFVKSIEKVQNADSAMLALGRYDLKTTSIIEMDDAKELKKSSYQTSGSDYIRLTNYGPNELTYEYSAGSDQFAVFSEIYYQPGWKAFINDKEVDFTKVDYFLRGMEIPSGKGAVRFSFEPFSVSLGEKLVWLSSIVILALIGSLIFKKQKSKSSSQG